jgi:lipopolysaccharide export system protein LptC
MSLPLDRLYPIIALAALAGATLWLERVTAVDDARPSAQTRTDPDFIGEKIHLTNFDATGAWHYELHASKVTHYPQRDVSELVQPRIRYEHPAGTLQVTALHGESSDAGRQVYFSGEVKAVRKGTQDKHDMTLTSDTLRLWPDEQRAETTDPVVLTQGETVAHARAMKADNLIESIQLLGDAKVRMPRSSRTRP